MMKRIIALLLALILTVGLLPTVALAAEGETPTTDSGSVTKEARKDNLNLVKTVTKDGENYKVTLESWATGIVTTTTETKPLDIVLLLDFLVQWTRSIQMRQSKSLYRMITDTLIFCLAMKQRTAI